MFIVIGELQIPTRRDWYSECQGVVIDLSHAEAVKRLERVRLYPKPKQAERLQFSLDVTRELYNALLEQRREAYRRNKAVISSKMQYKELTALRKVDARVAAVYRECEDAVLRRLDLAFAAYFRRVKRGKTPGYPRYKPAVRWTQLEYQHADRALKLNAPQNIVSIPGIGRVRLRKGRSIPPFTRAFVVLKNGRWYASFVCDRAISPIPKNGKLIGVDRGVHVLAATSDGILFRNPAFGERNRDRVAAHNRELELRTVRDAAGRVTNQDDPRRRAAVLRLARTKEREANRRRDYLHKKARELVQGADIIAIEALDIRAMTRSARGTRERPGSGVRAKAALNRRVLDSGFGQLERLICEKAEEAARVVLRVGARFSSQECSRCGHVARESRRRRRFHCVRCAFRTHADVNSALVIRRRAQLALSRMLHAGAEPTTSYGR